MRAARLLRTVQAPSGRLHLTDIRQGGFTLCGKGVPGSWRRIGGPARVPDCKVCARAGVRRYALL